MCAEGRCRWTPSLDLRDCSRGRASVRATVALAPAMDDARASSCAVVYSASARATAFTREQPRGGSAALTASVPHRSRAAERRVAELRGANGERGIDYRTVTPSLGTDKLLRWPSATPRCHRTGSLTPSPSSSTDSATAPSSISRSRRRRRSGGSRHVNDAQRPTASFPETKRPERFTCTVGARSCRSDSTGVADADDIVTPRRLCVHQRARHPRLVGWECNHLKCGVGNPQ